MSEIVRLREFDTLTCEMDDKIEYGSYRLPKEGFDEVLQFAKEYEVQTDEADALEFMKIGYKRNVGDIISLNNYVGMIETKSGLQIEILPKIDFGEDEEDIERTKRVFLKMLRTMKDFEGKVFSDATLKSDKMNLYEIFINMYLQEVRSLVKKGIKSSYVEREDNLNFYKGKLLVNQHIRSNLVHKEKFCVSFDEFNLNRAENKLIKATLLKLKQLTTSNENSKEILKLLTFFEGVDTSVNYSKDFSKVVNDRNTKDYKLLMQWSKVFLLNQSFTTFSGSSNAKAILFPMEKVYESYVAKILRKELQPLNWEVSTQDKGMYLFEQPNKQFALRPDIVLYKDNRCIVLDTKWKALKDNPGVNYGISQSDMYQMVAYSKKYTTSEIWLLYPLTREFKDHEDIWFSTGVNDLLPANVNIFFVDLNDETNIKDLAERIIQG